MLEPLIVKRDTETIELSESGRDRDRHGVVSQHARLLLRRGFVRRGRVLAQRRDVAQSRCRNFEGAAAWPGDDSGKHVVDRFVALFAARRALQRFRRHFGRDDARVLVWKASTVEMNPSIDKRIIDEAYEDDPESAKAEYGGEFRTDLADYVSRETIDAVIMWGRCELPPEPGVTYSGFVDPSGGVSDSMTLAIGHLGRNNACVLDAAVEVRPPLDPEQTVAEFAALLRRYGVTKIVGDKYGGEWPRARFAEHGIEFEQSARPKSDLYRDLLPLAQRPSRRVARPAALVGPALRAGAAHGALGPRFDRPCPGRPRRFGQCGRWRAGGRRFRSPAAAGQA